MKNSARFLMALPCAAVLTLSLTACSTNSPTGPDAQFGDEPTTERFEDFEEDGSDGGTNGIDADGSGAEQEHDHTDSTDGKNESGPTDGGDDWGSY